MKAQKIQKIETIRKKYHREWLLIVVDEYDEKAYMPLTGRLIFHSPRKEDVYQRLLTPDMKKRYNHIMTIYSEKGLPKGYAAAF